MNKNILNALVAIGLLGIVSSCSKDNESTLKPITSASYNPLDPQQFGYINRGDGELYHYDDSVSTFGQVGVKYSLFNPLSLEKYKNGQLVDSICNKDLAIRFESKGKKTHDKSVLWGLKPWVFDEHPPIITFRVGNTMTFRFSKMLTGFGFEFNTPYTGIKYGVSIRVRNSKLDKIIRPTYTSFTTGNSGTTRPFLGMIGGAMLNARESQTPFDEVRITFEDVVYGYPPPSGPFDISLAGFRYKLAN